MAGQQPFASVHSDSVASQSADSPTALGRVVQLLRASWGALLIPDAHDRLALDCAVNLPDAAQAMLDRYLAHPLSATLAGYKICNRRLHADDTLLGWLLVGFADRVSASAVESALVDALADGLAMQLYNAHLRGRIGRLTIQLGLINCLGQYTASIHDRQQLFGQITQVIYESLGYNHIQLLLINPQTEVVELVHASGAAGVELLRQGFSEAVGGRGIIGWVAGSGQVWVSDDVTRDPHFRSHGLLPHTAAEITLPLRIGDRIIGVLDVQIDRVGSLAADDIVLLETVADQIAPALEYNRLFAAERYERELATTLRDITRIISSSLELDQVLDLILQQIDRVVPHNGTRITLRDDAGMMRVVAAKGYPDNERAKRSSFRIEDAPLSAPVLYEQQTLVVADARDDPRWFWQMGAEQVRSWCGAPLVIKREGIGWLCVDWAEPHFYTEEHGRNLRAFADQVVVAIENARLYAAVKEFSEQLEQKVQQRTTELRQARDEIALKAEQLSALVQRVVRVQEAERQRIAHDLHDGATQSILAAIYELQALRRRITSSGISPSVDARLEGCQQLLDGTLGEMKRIIYALRPRALDELGLLAALDNLVVEIRTRHALEVSFHVVGTPCHLPDEVELAIYRIVQETTQNSLRHANARILVLTVTFQPQMLHITISDDGCGLPSKPVGHGLGLVGMQERALALGGRLTITSQPDAGTQIVFEIERSHWITQENDHDSRIDCR